MVRSSEPAQVTAQDAVATREGGIAKPSSGGRFVQVMRSLASTVLLTAAMVGAVIMLGAGPLPDGTVVDFNLSDLQGGEARSDVLRGKPVVLYFWATWCTACKLTTGTVEGFAARNPEVPVLAVSAESPDHLSGWVKSHESSLRVVAEGGRLMHKLGVKAFPTTVILDKAGRVLWNRSGVLVPGELELRL